MAEILLSLTIIGVVAAITLPSLTGNINERTWNTQRKALYARFSQAIALMPNLNGYGTLSNAVEADADAGIAAEDAVDTAAETFVTDGLAKVMKINNICDSEHLIDCGMPQTVIDLQGNVISNFTTSYDTLSKYNTLFTSATGIPIDTKAAAFETQNGESIMVYYNPNCVGDLEETFQYYIQPKMCANFIYDLNGSKGPNTMGKDIGFISALYPSDPVIVAPLPLTTNATGTNAVSQTEAGTLCKNQDSESRLPNRDEMAAMFYNMKLVGISTANYWSSSVVSSGDVGKGWVQYFDTGYRTPFSRSFGFLVRCVKR